MSNTNRDFLIICDVKNSKLTINRPIKFYITDKNTSNIFIRLVTQIAYDSNINKYVDIEPASNFAVTMRIVKPNNEVKSVTASKLEEGAMYQVDLQDDCKDILGIYKCELLISTMVNGKQELNTSDMFTYKVERSVLSNVDEIIETEDTTVEDILNRVDTVNLRIDNLAKLSEGSTTGDAELIDIRIGADGIVYNNAGNAVRNIGKKVIQMQDGEFPKVKINGYNKKPLLHTAFSANNATQQILTNNGRNIVWNKQGNFMGVSDSTIINDVITLSKTDRILFISKITVNQNDFGTLDYRLNLSGLGTESIYKTVITTENNKEYYLGGIVPINSDYTTPTARGISVTIAGLNDTSKTINIDINSVYAFIIKDTTIELDTSNIKSLYNKIDNNVFTVTLNLFSELNLIEKDVEDLKKDIENLKNNPSSSNPSNSKWKGKNVLVLGDSISSDYYLGYDSWATQLARIKGFNLVNRSVHANGFICSPDSVISGNDSMINKIDTVHSAYPNSSDFDLIIMFMGTNDFGNSIPLGKMGDGNKDKSLITTFHGGVEYCMRKALEYWCSARIVVFTPMQRRTQIYATSEGKNLKDYRDVIVEKANYMGYPVLDLYNTSGFYPVKKAFNAIITIDGTESTNNAFCNMYCMKPDRVNPDGLHPNELFTTSRLVPLISSFIENI